jgi:NitT/TauT family transport system ATP-binding protein
MEPSFRELVDRIYGIMTKRLAGKPAREGVFPGTGLDMALRHVSSNTLAGLLETVDAKPYDGKADLPHIAQSLQMEIDDLFPIAETLQLLRFAELEEGDLRLTPEGRRFAHGKIDERKRLFAEHLLTYVPIAGHIRRVLDERPSHHAPATRFKEELEDYMSPEFAGETLHAAISWGRYGEVYAYDEQTDTFSLENPA